MHEDGTSVAYKVVFLKGDESVATTTWAGRDRAIAHAREDLPFREKRLGATAAYVVEVGTRSVIFVLPASRRDGPPTSPESEA
jgi:hypothetical protein